MHPNTFLKMPFQMLCTPMPGASLLNCCWRFLAIVGLSQLACLGCLADDALDFGRDIRPILSNNCFTCHGPDENTRAAELRLDTRSGLFGESSSGEIPVVPGAADNSFLLRRIESLDDDIRMPPPEAEHQLSDREKRTLREWVKQGASWNQHWAFVAPVRPELPVLPDEFQYSHPIDGFVYEHLKTTDLRPTPRASRETLLRRVYLDLTGLPPTLKDREAFLGDQSPDAYEQLVDRLLASPHFGEQMATQWLDAARYADSNGYQNDFGRSMWPWRDWVVSAINNNQPFDEFVIEQIAGDLLPNATLAQKVATGFNRNNRTVTEGGSIDEEWLVENVVDRVETTSATLLGLTMGCARCHDHKFDPVSQAEFYQFFAFFNNVNEKGVYQEHRGNSAPLIAVPTGEQSEKMAKLDARTHQLNKRLQILETELVAEKSKWESQLDQQSDVLPTSVPEPVIKLLPIDGSESKPGLEPLADSRYSNSIVGRAVGFDNNEEHKIAVADDFRFRGDQPFSVTAWVKPDSEGALISRMDHNSAYRGFDIIVLADGRINVHLIHRWTDDAIKITTHRKLKFGQWNHVAVTWNGSGKSSGLQLYVDTTSTSFDVNNDSLTGDTTTDVPLVVGWRGNTPSFGGRLTDVRIFDRQLNRDSIRSLFGLATIQLAKTAVVDWDKSQTNLADLIFRSNYANQFAEILDPLAEIELQRIELKRQFPTTMIMEEREERRATYVLNRGVYDQPVREREIFPGVPAFLPGFKAEHFLPEGPENNANGQRRASRLTLARWLVDRDNPLTARVTVNRIWQHHFGNGLVKTAEDFGIQSPLPSHPKLLDWLAVEFMEHGWDVKRLHKTIVMSETYQQSTRTSAENYLSDPENQWLARGPRFRLSAEEIRDNALVISGLFNPEMSGPPIKPYQPAGLWKELAGGASQGAYKQDQNDRIYRRSIYINRKRTVPPPSMTTFDAGSRETCQVARQRTNTPLQALALLNDETYVEAARNLASQVIKDAVDDRSRIIQAFIRATLRQPTEDELAVLERGLSKYRKRFVADPQSAKQLVSVGQSPVDAHANLAELAAFTSVAGLILNLDETITRE